MRYAGRTRGFGVVLDVRQPAGDTVAAITHDSLTYWLVLNLKAHNPPLALNHFVIGLCREWKQRHAIPPDRATTCSQPTACRQT